MKMKKVNSIDNYDYYIGKENSIAIFNIVLKSNEVPKGGYYNKEYIAKIKNVNVSGFKI